MTAAKVGSPEMLVYRKFSVDVFWLARWSVILALTALRPQGKKTTDQLTYVAIVHFIFQRRCSCSVLLGHIIYTALRLSENASFHFPKASANFNMEFHLSVKRKSKGSLVSARGVASHEPLRLQGLVRICAACSWTGTAMMKPIQAFCFLIH